ncbi:MAG: hypothetical protein HY731_01265, partial [Candidatus Tectomicrobia bacterium]|nr:hypothetical protein [Candidatus Tectomicrobia bacterium]
HMPCLWVAVCGRRNPEYPEHTHFDPELSLTWNLKDLLPAQKALYYGRLIYGKPTMVSLEHFPSFYALHGPEYDEAYLSEYERGLLSRGAKRIIESLREFHPQTTKELKWNTGMSRSEDRTAFDRAISELQQKMWMVMIEARYEPTFTYLWDLLEYWLPGEVEQGRKISRGEAISCITEKYLSVVHYTNLQQLARLVTSNRERILELLDQLSSEGKIEMNVEIQGLPGKWIVQR